MQLSSLLQSINPSLYKASAPIGDINIKRIVYDSRQVEPGDLYVAVVGTQADGHEFIPQAIQQGAVAIVCNEHYAQEPVEQVCWLSTSDTPGLLAELSATFYDRPSHKMNMIGITGTNGKTTVAWLTASLLNALETPTGWIGTLGADFKGKRYPGKYTTPFPPELQNLLHSLQKDGAACMVMECSSHALIQQRLGSIPFKIGVFSNLTQDHLDYHGTLQHYGEAKALLFSKALAKNGVSILNADDPWCKHYANVSKGKVITYGIHNQADLQASDIQLNQESTVFELKILANGSYRVNSPLTGAFNVYNLLAAIATAFQLGHKLPAILEQIPSLTAVPGRLERVSKNGNPFGVYVDYAHTPDSLENVLKTLRKFTTHKLHVVVGCGGDRDKSKRPIMAKIAESLADNVILTSDNPRSEDPLAIIQDMRAGLKEPSAVQEAPDRANAITLAIQNAGLGDQVLIAGKGHETYQIIGSQTFDFDDRAVAQEALAHLI